MTRHAGRLIAVIATAGLLAVIGVLAGLGLVTGLPAEAVPTFVGTRPSPQWLAVGVLVATVAQLARLEVRAGSGLVRLAWGEAAVVILCAMLPPVWVPAVVLVGVALKHLIMRMFGDGRSRVTLVYGVAALTLAASAAVVVAAAVGPAYGEPLGLRMLLALGAAAGAYTLMAAYLVSFRVAVEQGGDVTRTFLDTLSSKSFMIVGNLVVGLLVVICCHTDKRFIVLVVPVFWLLHQTYAYRLRGDDERRTWQAFAEATGELNRLDEHDAVRAGIRGAVRLFQASMVEVVLNGPDGRARRYLGGSGDEIHESPVAGDLHGWEHIAVRPLLVGGVHIGSFRLRLPSSSAMRPRDHLMFAAYGDAFAAAVHDAVTHGELIAMSERSTYDAVHDPLTGLANRAALLTRGNAMLRRLDRDVPIVLILLDINRFKEVNNALGPTAGDEVLRIVARRLAAAGVADELVARLGGDEFALLAPAADGSVGAAATVDDEIERAVRRARSLGEELAAPTEVAGIALSVEASIGIVVAAAGDVDMTELLRRADMAMYQAKDGGQSVGWYDADTDEASTDRLALLAEMREALLAGDQLRLVVQPVISLTNGMPTGAEALVRWRHPRRGQLLPDAFLPAIENSELIGPFTRYILDHALEIAARMRDAGLDLPISVNVSARSLLDAGLPREVHQLLRRHRLPADRLILEITESVVMSELEVVDQVLTELRGVGVQLSVDDFGTGYSTFTFLTRVPVEEIKIDREFVRTMGESPMAAAIVRTSVELARQLGLRVVAEGVETTQQRATLVGLGCTAAQGHLLHPPMPAEQAIVVLRHLRPENLRRLREDRAG